MIALFPKSVGVVLVALFTAAVVAAKPAAAVPTKVAHNSAASKPPPAVPTEIRYAAIGDSYSCGEGATPAQAWPVLLAAHLATAKLRVRLVANPSVTGWTTQQAIEAELPVFRASHPNFATLLIGVNDYVQGVDVATFQRRLRILLDAMQAALPDRRHLLLVTIPDFSVTPTGAQYAAGRDAAAGIRAFNAVIAREARRRSLPLVDIYPLSQDMALHPTLIAPDGLHPSVREYALWEKQIYPAAAKLLLPAK